MFYQPFWTYQYYLKIASIKGNNLYKSTMIIYDDERCYVFAHIVSFQGECVPYADYVKDTLCFFTFNKDALLLGSNIALCILEEGTIV